MKILQKYYLQKAGGAVAKSPEKRKTEDCKKAVTSVFFSGIIEL